MAEGPEALELLEGAAVEALSLGLVAEEQAEGVGEVVEAVEALGEGEVTVLPVGDLDAVGQLRLHGDPETVAAGEALVEAGSEEAGLEAGEAEEGLLGDGDALEGEELLGVGGLEVGDEVGAEAGDGIAVLQADDGVVGGGEAVAAGVLGRAGLAFGSTGAGGAGGVGAVGGKLLFGNGLARSGHSTPGSSTRGWGQGAGVRATARKEGEDFRGGGVTVDRAAARG